ncbi:biotin--[acetyl-CoA-carboxylase] ligase [Wenzhouxiangella sp. XN201]|uniref:biotin--[acetyl-CoA-carboxylase] ligase n=1 Tax=Wenzhouxiangella sp. XN201 TaxID=2710755 RepID=UPI0013C94F0B|nr:biotin--[acetyl-CoA-carboxylase] ligase [Wenzhouxiangella sp. XN201]NEZ02817.1 biotin--[acetyl-CoA-carboxylase] ligase [Wenzhouxiangella sp. XN201]
MQPSLHELFIRLADGRVHNGAELAEAFGITRAAVWKRVEGLRRLGLAIGGTAGDGYRLERPVELLDRERIRGQISNRDIEVEVAGAVDSTNARLTDRSSPHGLALVAEAQTAGRGRRGRAWLSPAGSGLYLSLGWHFESGLAGLAPLSLVVGLTVAETLERECGAPVRVKWPNDLFVAETKLGGCLVEIGGAAEGPCRAAVGVGINLYHTEGHAGIDQATAALEDHGQLPGRNQLAAALIDALAGALARFDRDGFEPFRARWPAFDTLADRVIRILHEGRPEQTGTACGIDAQGRLLVETAEGLQAIGSGEVSIRAI